MKNTTTARGRAKYGNRFMNHDDFTVQHACSVIDPRCDQAHQGPQFATFHRAFLLAWENSLLAVLKLVYPTSTVEAMPYWVREPLFVCGQSAFFSAPVHKVLRFSTSLLHRILPSTGTWHRKSKCIQQGSATLLDAFQPRLFILFVHSVPNGKYRNVPDKYIFSDNYFGDFVGDPNNEFVVTNGLFAYFPVPEWTSERFGTNSDLNQECTRHERHVGSKATICDRCCGKGDDCVCDPETDTFRRFLRGNDDLFRRQDRCIPYMTRNTWESPAINGMRKFKRDGRNISP
jgi:hypothetical protein